MKKFYKTFLSGLLAAAMIFTSVPEVAMAAALPDADTEILAEEISEGDIEAEGTALDAIDQDALPATEGEEITSVGTYEVPDATDEDVDQIDPNYYSGDIKIKFVNKTTSDTQVKLYKVAGDGSIVNGNIIADGSVSGTGAPAAATEADYVFYLAPKDAPEASAYQLADMPLTFAWTDYSAETAASGSGTLGTTTIDVDYTIDSTGNEAWDAAGVKKVTIKKELLAKVLEKSYINSTTPTQATAYLAADAGLVVTAAAAEAKSIYVAFDLTKASGCTAAISPEDAKLKWVYNGSATNDYALEMGTGVVTGLSAPDKAAYKIIQTGSGLDADLTTPTNNILSKTEYTPIVKKTAYEAADIADSTAAKLAEYNTSDHKLYIAWELLNSAAANGRTITIAVDTTETAVPKFTSVTADTTSAKYVDFNLTTSQDKTIEEAVPIKATAKSVDVASAGDLDTITGSAPVRTIKKVKVSADGGTTFKDATGVSPNYELAASSYDSAQALVVYSESTDGIVVKGVNEAGTSIGTLNTDYAVYGKAGTLAGTTAIASGANDCIPVTGKEYTFKVISKNAQYSITNVKYQFGKEAPTDAIKNADGSWSATTPVVSNTLTITVTMDNNNTTGTVKLASNYSDATIKDLLTNTAISTVGDQNFITKGKPYSFTLVPAATKYIKKITYQDGVKEAKSLTPADAEVADDGTMTFTTKENIEGNLVLTINNADIVDGYKLTAPVNKNVTVRDAEGNAMDPGQSIYVNGAEKYNFSVALASGVSSTDVTFKKMGNTSVVDAYSGASATGAGSWEIPAGTTDIALLATTDQIVPRNMFQVGWYPNANDGNLDDTTNLKLTRLPLTTAGTEYDYTTDKTTGTTNTEQTLTLAGTESINVLAKFQPDTNISLGATTVKQTSGISLKSKAAAADAIVKLANNSTTDVVVTAAVDANTYNTGSDFLVAETTVADKDLTDSSYTNTGNTLIFRAELPVTVVDHYESFRAVATSANSYNKTQAIEGIVNTTGDAYFYVLGTNGRTHIEDDTTAIAVSGDVASIDWETTPDVTNSGDPDFNLAANGTNSIHASAAKTSVTSITATPTVTLKSGSIKTISGTASTVKVSDAATYHVFPTVTVTDGVKDTFVSDNEGFTLTKTGTMTDLEINYLVYKEVKTPKTAVTDEASLKAAIDESAYVLATTDAAPVFTAANSNGSKIVYASGEASGSTYTVHAEKPSGAVTFNVTMNAKIDGIALTPLTIKVTVLNEATPLDVTLKIADVYAKNDKEEINRQVLTNDPVFVGNVSKILKEASKTDLNPGTGTTYGVVYSGVSTGSTFKLPALNDFDSNQFGEGRIPYGWKCGATYYELGETLVPAGNTEFELLWTDEYAIVANGIYNKNDFGTTTFPSTEDLTTTYASATNLVSAGVALNIDGEIPVVLKTEQVTGIVSTKNATGLLSAGDPVKTTTYVADGFTLSAATEAPADVFKNTSGTTTRSISGTSIVGQYVGSGTVKAEWTAPNSVKTSITTNTITVSAKKVLTIDASATTLNSNKALELSVGKAAKNLVVTLKNGGVNENWGTTYTYDVTVASSAVVEKQTIAAPGASATLNIPLKAVTEGTTTVSVTAKDNQGNVAYVADAEGNPTSSTTLTVNVVVSAAQVKIVATKMVDTNKVNVSDIELSIVNGNDVGGYDFSTLNTQAINVQAFAASDSTNSTPLTGGTWAFVGDATIVASNPGAGTNDGAGGKNITVAHEANAFGTGWIKAQFTPKDETEAYELEIPVKTYKPIVLQPGYDGASGSKAVTIVDKSGNKVATYDNAGTVTSYDSTFLKVFKDSTATTASAESYDISLDGYTAEYYDGSEKIFDGFVVAGFTKKANTENAKTSVDMTTGSDILGGTASNYGFNSNQTVYSAVLHPVFVDVPIKSIKITNAKDDSEIASGSTITLSDEVLSTDLTKATNIVALNIRVTDPGSNDTIQVVADKIGSYIVVDDNARTIDANKKVTSSIYSLTGGASSGTVAITKQAVAENKTRTDFVTIGLKQGALKPGTANLTFKSVTSGETLATLKVVVNGASYSAGNAVTGYLENEIAVKEDVRTVAANKVYFDEDGKALTKAGPVKVTSLDKTVLVNVVSVGTALPTANATGAATANTTKHVPYGEGLQTIETKTYYVKSDETGEIAINEIFKVNGVDRLFREDGTIVSYTDKDIENGKITVGTTVYVIDKDTNEAKPDHTNHVWTFADFNWSPSSGVPASAVANFTCETGKESGTVDATVTTGKARSNKEGTVTITPYIAKVTADPSGNSCSKSETVYYSTETGTYTTDNAAYKALGGGTSTSGQTISEPEQPENLATVNLFYTDVTMQIALPDGADVNKNSGKSAQFYTVDASGEVTVNPGVDRKKAATAANSLIILPIMGTDDDGNTVEIGEFEYQLPVTYVKPSLKLTSAKGIIKAGLEEASTVYTTVTEKKSTNLYEKIDVTGQKDGVAYWTGKSGNATVAAGDDLGQLAITTKAKASGKIGIQLENWNEKIELSYSVAESKKNVITAPKTLTMNVNAYEAGEAQSITVLLNGGEIDSESDVTVAMPKNFASSGITVEGIEDGKVTSSTITFSYGDNAPVKGNYTFKFATSDKASASFKLVVSALALDKAVTYKVQTQIDMVTGQKMVLVPTLKGISGEITDVSIEGYDVEYDDVNNQIIASAAEGTTPKKGTITVKATIGGVETATAVKISPTSKVPAVKISKIALPKTKVIAGTAEGTANIVSTYKAGGKTISVAPVSVKIVDGVANEDLGEGWFTVSKSNLAASYDAEAGVINVKALSGNTKGKVGAVKIELTYANGKVVKKSVSVKTNTKK